jgi:hypothetical protein
MLTKFLARFWDHWLDMKGLPGLEIGPWCEQVLEMDDFQAGNVMADVEFMGGNEVGNKWLHCFCFFYRA